jgi:hypothetical protein
MTTSFVESLSENKTSSRTLTDYKTKNLFIHKSLVRLEVNHIPNNIQSGIQILEEVSCSPSSNSGQRKKNKIKTKAKGIK